MTPSDLPEFFLVEGLWIDRRIPTFWGEILIIKKIAFEIKISQCT